MKRPNNFEGVVLKNLCILRMSQVDGKYVQDCRRAPGTHGHWEGTPSGSSWTKGTCWLCGRGCAVLSYLYWKKLEPTQVNVVDCLNDQADVNWSHLNLTRSPEIVAPSIGKVRDKSHYVFIKSAVPGKPGEKPSEFEVFDPNGGKLYRKKVSEFECCWKQMGG